MPRTYSSIDKIRAEFAWINEPVDPNVCGCRHLRCCESEGHAIAKCPRTPTRAFWSFRREHYCEVCIEYKIWRVEDARIHDGAIRLRSSFSCFRIDVSCTGTDNRLPGTW